MIRLLRREMLQWRLLSVQVSAFGKILDQMQILPAKDSGAELDKRG